VTCVADALGSPTLRFSVGEPGGPVMKRGIDLFHSREGFLAAARAWRAPVFVAIGEQTPPKSFAEMKALAELPTVRSTTIPGRLAFYDGYPGETAAAVAAFLDAG
jgi:hypothetical protein